LLKILKQIKNNPREEQNLKFSIKIMNKTAACTAQLAKCILLHAYSRTTAAVQVREHKQNFL